MSEDGHEERETPRSRDAISDDSLDNSRDEDSFKKAEIPMASTCSCSRASSSSASTLDVPLLVRLTYFDGKGRAELIRLVLAVAGLEYEDRRLGARQWQRIKKGDDDTGA